MCKRGVSTKEMILWDSYRASLPVTTLICLSALVLSLERLRDPNNCLKRITGRIDLLGHCIHCVQRRVDPGECTLPGKSSLM